MRSNKGLTLISLVVTIVVMLILVGVTIRVTTNTGLIDKTQDAADNWNNNETIEKLSQKITKMAINSTDGSIDYSDIKKEIDDNYSEIMTIDKEKDSETGIWDGYIIFNNGYIMINNEKIGYEDDDEDKRLPLSKLGDWTIDYEN